MDTHKEIEQIVQQDPHVTRITYATMPQLPDVDFGIAYDVFSQLTPEKVKECVEVIYRYLHSPTIVDNFENHAQRRVWIEEMEQRHGQEFTEYIHKNKLRGNTMMAVHGWSSYLGSVYEGKRGEDVERLTQLMFNLGREIADEQTMLHEKLNLLPLFDQTLIVYISLFTKEK